MRRVNCLVLSTYARPAGGKGVAASSLIRVIDDTILNTVASIHLLG